MRDDNDDTYQQTKEITHLYKNKNSHQIKHNVLISSTLSFPNAVGCTVTILSKRARGGSTIIIMRHIFSCGYTALHACIHTCQLARKRSIKTQYPMHITLSIQHPWYCCFPKLTSVEPNEFMLLLFGTPTPRDLSAVHDLRYVTLTLGTTKCRHHRLNQLLDIIKDHGQQPVSTGIVLPECLVKPVYLRVYERQLRTKKSSRTTTFNP